MQNSASFCIGKGAGYVFSQSRIYIWPYAFTGLWFSDIFRAYKKIPVA